MMKILLADDDDSAREAVKSLAVSLGHAVIEATDGTSAWDAFGRHKPTAVISDWMMPGLSGLSLCKKIREASPGTYTYFMLLTGRKTSHENYLEAMAAGVDDFLTKPADSETFQVRLRVAERVLSMAQRIDKLENFLPICSYCRRVRQKGGDYEPLEEYISKRAPVQFSHGICPDCFKKHHPEGETR